VVREMHAQEREIHAQARANHALAAPHGGWNGAVKASTGSWDDGEDPEWCVSELWRNEGLQIKLGKNRN
jgi:hypothetical protein